MVTGALPPRKSYCSHSYLWNELSINVFPPHSNFRQHISDVTRARFSLDALQGTAGPMTYWVIRNILPSQLIRPWTRALTGVVRDQFKWRGPADETVGVLWACVPISKGVCGTWTSLARPHLPEFKEYCYGVNKCIEISFSRGRGQLMVVSSGLLNKYVKLFY